MALSMSRPRRWASAVALLLLFGSPAAAQAVAPATAPGATAGHPPEGRLTSVTFDGQRIRYSGWAFDRDDLAQTVSVTVAIDGMPAAGPLPAHDPSPELYPYGLGQKGFRGATIVAAPGSHRVCIYAHDIVTRAGTLVDCRSVTVSSPDPRGDMAISVGGKTIGVYGWAVDESDLTRSIGVIVTENGRVVLGARADQPSPFLTNVPGDHAFLGAFPATSPGWREVCLLGENYGPGASTVIACQYLNVPSTAWDPVGELGVYTRDVDRDGRPEVHAGGFGADNDTTGPIEYVIFLDGRIAASGLTWWDRGFDVRLGEQGTEFAAGTSHEVCLYLRNAGFGTDRLVKCERISL